MTEDWVCIKAKEDLPIVGMAILLAIPLMLAVAAISRTAALIVGALFVAIGFLLTLGTPPIYLLIVLVMTTLYPIGLFLPAIKIRNNKVDIL